MRVVQLQRGSERRVAVVDEPFLQLLEGVESVYDLVFAALADGVDVTALLETYRGDVQLAYDAIYNGEAEWQLRAPIDHPEEPARCLISGTGLTHLGSAKNRNAMHDADEAEVTDSMKMFQWGVERGRLAGGKPGVAPEWFYKGNGSVLRPHGAPLVVPSYANDGGEEGEIAGVYVIGLDGEIYRVGMAVGNEFSDHVFEKKNYLNLAGSKLRMCSLGPELVIDPTFTSLPGRVRIVRGGHDVWSSEIQTGEDEMSHSLQNIEHHHFKFAAHRRPGDVHIHYYGACNLSFGDGVSLEEGDLMEIQFDGFGRALRNPLQIDHGTEALQGVHTMH